MIIMQRLWILSYLLMSSYLHQITLGRRTDKSFSCSHTLFYVSLPLSFCSLSIVLCARNFSCRIWKSLLSFRVAGSESEQVLASLVLRQLCLFCLTGLISFEEFHQTWKLFSSHMNIELTDDGINDLVRSIDFNKDGNIDFNEFLEAFRLVKQSQQWEARAGHHIQCLVCKARTASYLTAERARSYKPEEGKAGSWCSSLKTGTTQPTAVIHLGKVMIK